MEFDLRKYHEPDFSSMKDAPDASLVKAERDGVAPEGYHAMSIFPEYFKIDGKWLLAEESRMDCTAVYKDGKIEVTEPRRIRKDLGGAEFEESLKCCPPEVTLCVCVCVCGWLCHQQDIH